MVLWMGRGTAEFRVHVNQQFLHRLQATCNPAHSLLQTDTKVFNAVYACKLMWVRIKVTT